MNRQVDLCAYECTWQEEAEEEEVEEQMKQLGSPFPFEHCVGVYCVCVCVCVCVHPSTRVILMGI